MMCRLLADTPGRNPAWQQPGTPGYDPSVPKRITLPAGTILDGPGAHRHCVIGHKNTPPIAEPADAECQAMVDKFNATLPGKILDLKQTLQGKPFDDEESREDLIQTAIAYGVYNNEWDEEDD